MTPRQKVVPLAAASGCEMRKTAWRTSRALNSPQLSWNLIPLRNVMAHVLPSGAISHFSASSGIYAPVLRSTPTRNSTTGRLSSRPLMVCNQEKLVSYPRGATAILCRSSFALGGADVCAQATVTTSPIAPITPQRVLRCPPLCIMLSLRCQLDVFEVREVASDHAREHIFRNILGVHGCVGIQPEQRDLSKLVEFMVADLTQQARSLRRVHHRAKGLQPLFDERV